MIENPKAVEKIDKTKIVFFEKFKKLTYCQLDNTQKHKTQSTKIRTEREMKEGTLLQNLQT